MPIYEVEQGGKKFRIDAQDVEHATEALHSYTGDAGVDKSTKWGGKTFGERFQKVWDNPTPGGLVWLAKQAVEGVRGSVDAARNASITPSTEEEFEAKRLGREQLPRYTAQAASVMSPGVPKGTGGLLAVPGAAAAALPAVVDAGIPAATPSGLRVLQAADRVADATGGKVEVPYAMASDSAAVQRAGQGVRNIPFLGDSIPKATDKLNEGLSTAVRDIADQYGHGSGPNVAGRVSQQVQDAADVETAAARDAAQRSDEAVRAAHQRDVEAANRNVAQRETQAGDQARAAVGGDMSPQDTGAALIQRLRTDERSARARKDALYDQAGRADASVRLDEVQNLRPYVVEHLENQGVVIDPQLTPAANRMIDELQRVSQLNIPNRAQLQRPVEQGTERVGVTVQGIEQARKRLVSLRQAANNDADRRAARLVMDRFDDWQSHAFENALISGDDRALQMFRDARAANTEWRQRFFNHDDDAGRFVERIVNGEVTPQEVANYVIGAAQVGAKGVSSRLLTRIADATQDNPEAMQAIRSGIWNRLTQATEGTDAKAPSKVMRDVLEFLNGSGRDVANRLFTPEQQRLMRAYADTLRNGQDARQLIGEIAENTRPGTTTPPAGPMKQLADAVLGRGQKSDEALFSTIDAYAKSGSRGDVATLAKLVQAIPQQDRQDLAGAIIRNLGVSPRTGQFSPDVFLSQWSNYTPQAKAVLFGNAGKQRQALDDISTISRRIKDVGSKFSNPSGTGQAVNFTALGAALTAAGTSLAHGDIVTPLAMLTTALGGAGLAKLLSAPATASSAAKWASAYEKLVTKPSTASVSLFRVASRNLASTAKTIGIRAAPNDFARGLQLTDQTLRSIQGPSSAGASDEKQ